MNKQDFYFDLPPDLIAQYPLEKRSDSRLLCYDRRSGTSTHRQFRDLPGLLQPGDLLVMNNSRVIPARFYGTKQSGGRVEFLIERLLDDRSFLAHIKASKTPRANSLIFLEKGWQVRIVSKIDDLYHCQTDADVDSLLADVGHIPLPPYIDRQDEQMDQERYQTVYARHKGSVAAPTAGLHFDDEILNQLEDNGVQLAYTTLHVGAGTFRPVRTERVTDHVMHSEQYTISEELCEAVQRARAEKRRVIAVGTTAMRSLESAAALGELKPCRGDTNIFIYPGYQFKLCDGLITNFHLPESTLLMLVSAFIGHPQAMALYQEAIAQRYRFFSYGDASLLL
ncbi:tRNA preQ1(34) S-adenosylmethionine ribosyltransferase-isomerase QueA [Legionella sp. CNM-4043-24]|uniref:tRNA preQ1(34) S-adenosylmethionine ribosyltransferase-isomerase QueA n=1 Tax=Legionella sp. CNM-4043-24 TaxID=3421646 RepID=UPI00403B0752